jgi:tetratricopeptide (TPR) repeat protein
MRAAWASLLAVLGLLTGATATAQARLPGFWERVADPEREKIERLIARAQAELEDRSMGGANVQSVARAVGRLEEVLRYRPRHFLASVLLGEAFALQKRQGPAIDQLARACAVAPTSDDEAWCILRLAVEKSKAARFEEALKDYDRHIRLGDAQPTAYANSAEILMALGRVAEAVERYRAAIRLEEMGRPGRRRDESLTLAHYGLAVALDRDEQPAAAREAMAGALAFDAKLHLLDAARDGRSDVFFVPAGDVHYYRGLALEVLGRKVEAAEAFRRFVEEQPSGRWTKRARAHLEALAPERQGAGSAKVPGAWRVVAAATLKADGPLPAPLVDAALKGKGHPELLEPCFQGALTTEDTAVRVGIDLELDHHGAVSRVKAALPPVWSEAAGCLEERLRSALRLPRPSRPRPTSVRLELVIVPRP